MFEVVRKGDKRVIRPKGIGCIQNNVKRRAAMLAVSPLLWLAVVVVGLAYVLVSVHAFFKMALITAPCDIARGFKELYHKPRKP
jgi:hypothetical protein